MFLFLCVIYKYTCNNLNNISSLQIRINLKKIINVRNKKLVYIILGIQEKTQNSS